MNDLYPIFLKIERQPVLVVGGGKVAEQKIKTLLEANADVTVVAPEVSALIQQFAEDNRIHLHRRKFEEGDVNEFSIVIGATDDREVQKKIYREAKSRNIPVNIVDVPDLCTFYLSSVFHDGELKIAVSTNGKSPTLGKIIRDKIADEFSDGYPELLERLGEIRSDVRNTYQDFESRKNLYERIASTELEQTKRNTEHATRSRKPEDHVPSCVLRSPIRPGKVILVGAGPGDPELITVKGIRILRSADVVVYDALVSELLLAEVPESAEKIYVGKRAGKHCMKQSEINAILLEKAREGKTVVRLKGGDPFIFGRGGEEVEFLKNAGIDVNVVPGITSGIGVPTSLGIPLTYRDVASSVAFVTGHEDPDKDCERINWSGIASADTIVVYMGVKRVGCIVERLIRSGMPPERPVAVMFGGTLPGEKIVTGTLESIEELVSDTFSDLAGLIVVGEVVNKFEDRSRQMKSCEPEYTTEESFR